VRPQGFTANLQAGQVRQQSGLLHERWLPHPAPLAAGQSVAGLLVGRQAQRLVRRTSTVAAPPAVMITALDPDRAQARLQPAFAPRLHTAPLRAAWTPGR
jgi:hypothetical protein